MKEKLHSDFSSGTVFAERRSGVDRRKRSMLAAIFRSGPRRRGKSGRRKADAGGYVDVYDLRTWSIAAAVLVLSLADAILTGFHVHGGSAYELNPVMKAVLNQGGLPAFFGLKAVMTILPMGLIMLHKEWTLGRYAARLCLFSYILVSLYHLYLIVALGRHGAHFSAGL